MSRVAALILAAGASSRFGSPKPLASVDGRPMVEMLLAVARAAGLGPIVVVLGHAADHVERGVAWGDARRVRNPDPDRGLASSLRAGLVAVAGLEPPVEAVVILLGDQPRTDPSVIARLLGGRTDERPVVIPRYAAGGGHNPVLLERSGFGLAAEATGDHGLGPVLDAHPELVTVVEVPGANPDVDTLADLELV